MKNKKQFCETVSVENETVSVKNRRR